MKEDEMRAVLIYGKADDDMLSEISNRLPTWRLEDTNDSGYPKCLRKDDVEIRLNVIAPNILRTVNVFPHDLNQDQTAANLVLKTLADELDAAGISNEIAASDNDVA
ncbi:hypothetical protein PQR33_40460 [Paraburkholderia sediminicola]|uniref:hypothetical protein n=1 Tax=Paraburkholderia sediminicola TaxID=458836 RepID=UPI0038B91B01